MNLLQMSFTGGVLIAVITVLRAATLSRLPKKAFLALWAVVLVRLLVPFSLPSVFSVYTYVEPVPAPALAQPVRPVQPVQTPVQVPAVSAPGVTTPAPEPEAEPLVPVEILLWGLGAGVCLAYFGFSYWKCRREFEISLPVEGFAVRTARSRRAVCLRQSDRISAPLTYGILYPVILMPKNTNWNDKTTLQYVLAHELVHIRRFDAATKLVLTGAVCVHWFNPLVWVMYILANRDLELSCDEEVVRQFGLNARSAYAMTLIGMEEQRSGLSGLYSCFNKNAMEERITAIMKTKKLTISAVCAALVLVIGITAAFATSAMPEKTDAWLIPGFTLEESETLRSIWCDGDEELTVAQYRDKVLKLRDDPAVEALFQRLDAALQDHSLDGARRDNQTLNEFLMCYTDLCKPLLFGDSYTFHFTHYGPSGDALTGVPWLECENQLTVLKPEILTVRTYNDARLDIFDSLGRVWDGTTANIEAVELEYQRLMEKWNSEAMIAAISAVVREGWEEDLLEDLAQNWDQLLAPYLPFGLSIELNLRAALEGSGLRMTYQGHVVRGIVDGESWITETAGSTNFDPDSIELFVVRDANGNLIGLRLPTEEENSQYWKKRVWTSFSKSLSSQFYEGRQTVPGTKEDYETLFRSVKITGYKGLSLKEFNALVLNWGNKYFNAYESIGEDTDRSEFPMKLSEEELEFLRLTMPLSQEENYRIIQSIQTDSPPEDPWVAGEQVERSDGEWAWCNLWYQFSYHVADKNVMTVAERDRRVGGFMGEVKNFFQEMDFDVLMRLSEADVVKKMQEFAKKYSDKQLTIAVDGDRVQFESMDERDTHVSAENTGDMIPAVGRTGGDGGPWISGYVLREELENYLNNMRAQKDGSGFTIPLRNQNGTGVGDFTVRESDWTWNYNDKGELLSSVSQQDYVPLPGEELVNGGYPVNSKGHTYGSTNLYNLLGEYPDLIPAQGDNGTVGYLRRRDLRGDVNTPEEALWWNENMPDAYTLYDAEENVIGTFTVPPPAELPEFDNIEDAMDYVASDGYKEYQNRPE